jgi:hypothetical protein
MQLSQPRIHLRAVHTSRTTAARGVIFGRVVWRFGGPRGGLQFKLGDKDYAKAGGCVRNFEVGYIGSLFGKKMRVKGCEQLAWSSTAKGCKYDEIDAQRRKGH